MKQFILMADIIGSAEKSPQTLMTSFKEVVDTMNSRYKKWLISPLTITLGDEFQGVVDSLKGGMQLIFSLDEHILKSKEPFYLRYVLHYGDIATPLNRESAHGMLGEGLTAARETLENMKKGDREVIISGVDESVGKRLNMAYALYRSLYNDWRPKDRQTVYDFLQVHDYKKVAAMHDRDNSSMWRKEKSLKIREFTLARNLLNLLADE